MSISKVDDNLIEITRAFEAMRMVNPAMKKLIDSFDLEIWKEQLVEYANDYETERPYTDKVSPEPSAEIRKYADARIRAFIRMDPPRHRGETEEKTYFIRVEEKRVKAIAVKADCFENALNRAEERYLDGEIALGKPSVMFTDAWEESKC